MVARVTNVKYYVCSTGRSMLLIHTVRTDCSSLKYGNTYVSSAVRASRQQKESGILWLHRKTVSLVVRFIAANTVAPKQHDGLSRYRWSEKDVTMSPVQPVTTYWRLAGMSYLQVSPGAVSITFDLFLSIHW